MAASRLFKVYHSEMGHPVFSVLFFNLLLKSLIFSRKSCGFGHHIQCQEMARSQDFTPFTTELLGAMSGPEPCRKVASLRRERITSDPLSVLRTHHFGLATPLVTYEKCDTTKKLNGLGGRENQITLSITHFVSCNEQRYIY